MDGSWGREIITVFDANRPDFQTNWSKIKPQPKLLWRIHKNDLVKLDMANGHLLRVVSIMDNYLRLAGHEDTNIAERYRDGEFKWVHANYDKLKELRFRRVTVSPIGELRDPAKTP